MSNIDYEFPQQPRKIGNIIDSSGNDVNFQILNGGGYIDLGIGFTGSTGFYLAVFGDEGTLNVKLKNGNDYVNFPFFKGWNPVLLTEVRTYSGNTATDVYWGI